MNIRDRLVEIAQKHSDWVDPYAASVNTADQILEEFWPVPKEFFVHKTMTDGTLLFELKQDDDSDYFCCEFCG